MVNKAFRLFLIGNVCLLSQGLLAEETVLNTVSGDPTICHSFELELKSMYAHEPFGLEGLERVIPAADAKPVRLAGLELAMPAAEAKALKSPMFAHTMPVPNSTPVKLTTNPRAIIKVPISVDFNNDGQLDQVFKHDIGGNYITGTILYVLLGVSSDELTEAASSFNNFLIFPCQFDRSQPAAGDCPTVSQKADEAGISVGPVFFRGRYTDIQLLRYDGETFLRLRGLSADTKQFAAIIKPVGPTGFESVCLFERGK